MELPEKISRSIKRRKESRQKRNVRPEVLTHPNVPKPMHGVVPREILGKQWWDKTRREAYRSTDYHCLACGISKRLARWHKWLEGHELYDVDYLLGRMTYIETVPLCHACHAYTHSGRLLALLEKGEVSEEKYNEILDHGESVLRKAGVKRGAPYNGPTADWGDWRLVLYGKEYPPKYETFERWVAEFGCD